MTNNGDGEDMESEHCLHLVIMGVAGSGKTTVAQLLAARMDWPAAEADDFHSQDNIEKMAAGHPLDDDDRWSWLWAIRDWMSAAEAGGENTIVTCSALKRSYRDVLRESPGRVSFVHLDGPIELLEERIQSRSGHFMPAMLLPSQISTLEALDPDEDGIRLDINSSPEDIVASIVNAYHLHSTRDAAAASELARRAIERVEIQVPPESTDRQA